MPAIKHADLRPRHGVHGIVRWSVLDEAARLALSLSTVDVGGVAQQLDTKELYVLKGVSPAVWAAFAANSDDAYLLARENHTGEQAISTITGLQDALDDLATADTSLASDLSDETSARVSADSALAADISTEASARSSADSALAADISTEASARAAADTSLSSAISAETSARASADSALAADISTEASARASADSALSSAKADKPTGTLVDNALVRCDGTGGAIQVSLVTVDDSGNISLPSLATVDGRDVSVDGAKLDGIAAGAAALTSSAPSDVAKATASVGVAADAARADHQHSISTAAPSSVGTANSEGSASSLARSDHVHNHGAQTDGSLHAAAVAGGASGFLTGTDKTKLDGIASGAQVCSEANVRTATAAFSANPSFNSKKITSLADGSADTDSATYGQVLAVSRLKTPCRTLANSNLTLSGTQTVDSIALSVGDYVLCYSQTNTAQNGPWVVQAGAWTRPPDFDTSAKAVTGATWRMLAGTWQNQEYYLSTTGDITLGTTGLAFARGQPNVVAGGIAGFMTGAQATSLNNLVSGIVTNTVQANTSYTVLSTDMGKIIECTNASATTITVPANTLTAKSSFGILQYGAGQVTVAAGAGLTLRTPLTAKSRATYSMLTVYMYSATEAIVGGDMASS